MDPLCKDHMYRRPHGRAALGGESRSKKRACAAAKKAAAAPSKRVRKGGRSGATPDFDAPRFRPHVRRSADEEEEEEEEDGEEGEEGEEEGEEEEEEEEE